MPESVRLFALCDSMNFAVLPLAGGLYDQHPKLIDEWTYIFQKKAEREAIERERNRR